ncbi:c-type cytochrome [Aurantivibrio plasticivorans]
MKISMLAPLKNAASKITLLFVSIGFVSGAGISVAEDMSIEETIKARQHSYRDLGGAFKSIRDQLRTKKPNIYLIQPTVQQMKDIADIDVQRLWFPEGSGPEAGVETEAKAAIWENPEEFAKAQQALVDVMPKFLELAYAKDIEGLKKHYRKVGMACKGCHDQFREEDD